MRIDPRVLLPIITELLSGCSSPTEAARVSAPVLVDASGLEPVETDLGYRVVLEEARVVLENLAFTVAGELNTGAQSRLLEWLIPVAHAHPGHYEGGEVTGELAGRFLVDFARGDGALLGQATLLTGAYTSANFRFALASDEDGLDSGDPLLGHTASLAGSATVGGRRFDFRALLESPEDRELVGAPCELDVQRERALALGLRLLTRDPVEGETLFDGIDFEALDDDGDGRVELDARSADARVVEATLRLRRAFQSHDHFDVRPQEVAP